MWKRRITAMALAALAAVAISLGVVAAPAAAAPHTQSCHGRIVSTVVQPSNFGPGLRTVATGAFGDNPRAVQDTQRVVRAYCAGPVAGSTAPFFVASTATFWLPVPGTDCFELYRLADFTPILPDPGSTERASAVFDYTDPQARQGQLTILSGVNFGPYAVSVLAVETLCGAVA